ncbi:helix-turn-helix transcriptional regulator [Streptomyces sp. NPDC046716]|uniref:helix-turn-helix domain-containing protein n=1 Tax=Streptomyces sp. NPDC046716 TaxID=3157093 RepID=UPI0033EF0041
MTTQFGEVLQGLMENRRLTPRAVSRASGLAESTIRQLLVGRLQPTVDLVHVIGPALDIPAADLRVIAGLPAERPHATAARDVVMGYIGALGSAGEAMRTAFPLLEQLSDVLGLVRTHQISRRGEAGSYAYSVHGAGCLFTSQDGSEIDVDFEPDGTLVFNAWRLRFYAQSLPDPLDLTEQELRSAVELLRPLLVEVRPGWFSVAGGGPVST